MKKVDAGTRNIGCYAAMSASHTSALPMVNGALMQLFLADRGLSTLQIGTFATVVQLSTLLGTIIFSRVVDKNDNPRRFTMLVLLGHTILSLCYLLLIKAPVSPKTILLMTTILAAAITVLGGLKGNLDYKLPYQIIPLERYGNMIFLNSAVNGVVGIGLSFCFSQIIATKFGGDPYLWCMLLASGLLLISSLCCYFMKPIESAEGVIRKNNMSTRQLFEMFRSPIFKAIIPPTILRGVTFGIVGSMVLVMLNLGYSDAETSKLPIITACGCLAAAGIHHFLSSKIKMPSIGTVGSILLLAVLFLPKGNTWLFYGLCLLVYTGQKLIDCTIPIMVIHIVDPKIAGAYNAWRNTILFLVSTISTYATALLLEKGLTTVVLVACAVGYFAGMVLHKRMYYRFTEQDR